MKIFSIQSWKKKQKITQKQALFLRYWYISPWQIADIQGLNAKTCSNDSPDDFETKTNLFFFKRPRDQLSHDDSKSRSKWPLSLLFLSMREHVWGHFGKKAPADFSIHLCQMTSRWSMKKFTKKFWFFFFVLEFPNVTKVSPRRIWLYVHACTRFREVIYY